MEELFRDSRENLECDFCNGTGLQISYEGIVVKIICSLLDLVFLHIQKDCLHMYYQLMGVKRYLISEKAIGEKRVEFFDKEEGHLYEKIEDSKC